MKNKIIALLPLRAGSKSLPMKNIRIFNGYPLAYWSLLALQKSKIDNIYVATDSLDIANTIDNLKLHKVTIYNRDASNAQDQSMTEDVILEFLNKYSFANDDIFILAQATSPFIKFQDINNSIEKLITEKADSLLSVNRVKRFFWSETGESINYDYQKRPRRQDFQGTLMENGAIYINKVSNIIKYKNRLSGKIALYEMSEENAIELDSELDWQAAEHLMQYIKDKR